MASNDTCRDRQAGRARAAAIALPLVVALLTGCSVAGPRHSPINDVTQNSPTVLDIYRGQTNGALGPAGQDGARQPSARDALRKDSRLRPVAAGDNRAQRYWSAVEPMNQRFARLPNPDLVMVVFPHLSKGKYPVPGYVTVFPMYEQTQYALPGEVEQELAEGRSSWAADQLARQAARKGP